MFHSAAESWFFFFYVKIRVVPVLFKSGPIKVLECVYLKAAFHEILPPQLVYEHINPNVLTCSFIFFFFFLLAATKSWECVQTVGFASWAWNRLKRARTPIPLDHVPIQTRSNQITCVMPTLYKNAYNVKSENPNEKKIPIFTREGTPPDAGAVVLSQSATC